MKKAGRALIRRSFGSHFCSGLELNIGEGFAKADFSNINFASAANYLFKFTVVGKNTGSTAYSVSFDAITLTPQ